MIPEENPSPTPTPLRKDLRYKLTAGLLALFLGWLGIHKFYLRQYGWGALYLLFTGTGLPLIAGVVEGIIILTMPDEKFNEKYNSVIPIVSKHPKRTASMLAFFLGCFGAHKFYLRETGWGVVYLLATVTGTFLAIQVLQANPLWHQLSALPYPDNVMAMMDNNKIDFNIPGLFWPGILSMIPSLAGIFDGFMLISMSDERFNARYKNRL